MRNVRNFLVLAIAFLAFSFVDVNAQNSSVNTPQSVQNIERKVYKELVKLPYYGVFDHIAFQVSGDTVTLYGKVVTPSTRKSAERYVKDVAGVRAVVNNIEVLPLSSFDDSIRYRTLRTLANEGGSLYRYLIGFNPAMRIIVERGHITLEGNVNSQGDANLANILAHGVTGSFSVTNNLKVGREVNY